MIMLLMREGEREREREREGPIKTLSSLPADAWEQKLLLEEKKKKTKKKEKKRKKGGGLMRLCYNAAHMETKPYRCEEIITHTV